MGKLEVYTAEGRLKTSGSGGGEPTADAHIADASDAHDASAISVLDTGGFYTSTEVEAALAELAANTGLDPDGNGDGAFRKHIKGGDRVWLYTDYMSGTGDANAGLDGSFISSLSNGALAYVTVSTLTQGNRHPGVLSCSTATNSAGRTGSRIGSDMVLPGNGKIRWGCWVKTGADLSGATQRYIIRAGLGNGGLVSSDPSSAGAFFKYSDDINSGKWQLNTYDGGVQATADSGTTVVADTWYKLEVEVNAAGTAAEYFINGSSVGTISGKDFTNDTAMAAGMSIVKTVGTTARLMYIDAQWIDIFIDTDR